MRIARRLENLTEATTRRDREVHWSCWSCMRFHATITNFRKYLHSLPSNFRHVFCPGGLQLAIELPRCQPHRLLLLSPHFSAIPKRQVSDDSLHRQYVEPKGDDTIKLSSSPLSVLDRVLSSSKGSTYGHLTICQSTPRMLAASSKPSTKWELLHHIRQLLSFTPAAPFPRLLSLHGRYPTLQSVESYNLLLLLSIRHSFSYRTRSLINQMAMNQIEPDDVTEKLVVRYLVSNGCWTEAWQQVMSRYSSVGNVPMPVLLELLAPGTRNIPRPGRVPSALMSHPNLQSSQHRHTVPNYPSLDGDLPTPRIPLNTFLLLLHRFPVLSPHELHGLPLRIISYVVRGLIRNGYEGSALLLTENRLKCLPSSLSPQQVNFARNLIHLHLSTGELKLANYKKRRRLVEGLMSVHPGLSPNATTVFLLMRYMERSKRCGIEAYLFFKNYRARWGTVIESLDVRRRIIEYALKQRKHGIAKEISQLPPLKELLPPDKRQPRHPTKMLPVRAWRVMYPRKGKEKRYWKRLFMRLLERRRVWKRRRAIIRWPKLPKD